MTAGHSLPRAEVWRGAALLAALTAPDALPSRYGAWPAVCAPARDLVDVVEATRWPAAAPSDLPRFQRCVAAAALASAWRLVVDGHRLRRLAESLSEPLLDAALSLDPWLLPEPCPQAADVLDSPALTELGRRWLLASLPDGGGTGPRGADLQARLAVDAGILLFERASGGHA